MKKEKKLMILTDKVLVIYFFVRILSCQFGIFLVVKAMFREDRLSFYQWAPHHNKLNGFPVFPNYERSIYGLSLEDKLPNKGIFSASMCVYHVFENGLVA